MAVLLRQHWTPCSSSPRVGDYHKSKTFIINSNCFSGSEVHLQCDVIQCYGRCVEIDDCSQVALAGFTKGNGNGPRKFGPNEEGSSIAGTTVFVLDPAEARRKKKSHQISSNNSKLNKSLTNLQLYHQIARMAFDPAGCCGWP